MRIGNVAIDSKLYLAPMAGVTDAAFRQICREYGAGLSCTELVSAKALCYDDEKSKKLLFLAPNETPGVVQIFGNVPEEMARAAKVAVAVSGADILDINMGCPTPKIVGNGDGCALMRDLRRAEAVIRLILFRSGTAAQSSRSCRTAGIPLTVTRLWGSAIPRSSICSSAADSRPCL